MTDTIDFHAKGIGKRHRAEKRLRLYGIGAIAFSLGFLLLIVGAILVRGAGAFQQHFIAIELEIDAEPYLVNGTIDPELLRKARYGKILKVALRELFPEAKSRAEKRSLYAMISANAEYSVRDKIIDQPSLVGKTSLFWVRASSDIDMVLKGNGNTELDESRRRVNDQQLAWLNLLQEDARVERRFNWKFLTSGDSREPEQAGILSAAVGSALSLLVCFALAFPIGVLSAVYLEEFAKKGRLSKILEVNINNLAAVPSIVFGLLGLAIFLNVFGLPRSSPLVGGMVLALMTLPTIIISSRVSLRSVPPSIRQAALGLGATKIQTTFHHVVPFALPGMLTGSIIGMAQALGETAPLLMIGMVAFIANVPAGLTDAATALPVQIFLWADSPERGFMEKASAAIVVLLFFLIVMNLAAIVLRRKLERRW